MLGVRAIAGDGIVEVAAELDDASTVCAGAGLRAGTGTRLICGKGGRVPGVTMLAGSGRAYKDEVSVSEELDAAYEETPESAGMDRDAVDGMDCVL
jgi:hypothetical protein